MSLVFACMAPHMAPAARPPRGLLGDSNMLIIHSREQHDTDGTDDNQSVLLLILEAKEYSTTFVVLVLL